MINQEVLDIDRIKECFETFFDAILIIDNNLKGFYFNQNFANLFNVESGTILAVPVEQIFDQLKICHEIPLLSQVLLKASPCEGGRYIAPESNSEVQWTYSPIIVDEQVQGIICTAKRYAATESLSNSSIQRLLPNVTQYLPGIIYEYIFDPEEGGRFIYISPQVSQLFGINAAAVLKDSGLLEKTIHEEDIKSFNETNEHCNREGLEWQWEGRIRVGKKVKWIEAKSSAIKQPNEKLLRYGIILDITERKLIEQRLELALKGADLGLWDYSFETKDVFISERWAKLLGYTQQEIEENHRNWMNFVHPEDACMVKELVIAHLKGQTEFYESVYRFKTKSGEWRWIMERGQVVARDIKGRALRWVGTVQDFHYRKLSEKVLADSEQRYRDLVEQLPYGVVVHADNIIRYVNQRTLKILGFSSTDEVIGRNVSDFIPQKYEAAMIERKSKVDEGKTTELFEMQLYNSQGEFVDVEITTMPFIYNEMRANHTLVADISERKQVQTQIRKNEKLYTQLFQNAPVAVVLLDEHHLVMQANKGFEEIFGYSEPEIKGKSLNKIIVPEDLRAEGEDLNKRVIHNEVTILETVRKSKEGALIPVIIYGFPVVLESKTIGIYGVYVDISAQKSIEEELQTRNTELDNFVYKVSHDLRAPLSSILGLVHLAKMENNTDDPRDYIKLIGKKVEQLDKFITDVLSHSKNLKMSLNINKVDFNEIMNTAFLSLNYLKGAETTTYSLAVQGKEFHSDPWRISEIFRNLLSNAIKYRNPDLSVTLINVDIKTDQYGASIAFSDNGVGISEENLPKIFEMFYRATELSEGSGIGLYIVKNAIDKLGGRIHVESQVNKGTTFSIYLPNLQA